MELMIAAVPNVRTNTHAKVRNLLTVGAFISESVR